MSGDTVDDYDGWANDGAPDDLPPAPSPHDDVVPLVEGVVPLGYDRDVFYYLSRSGRQVHAIAARAHGKPALMAMASVAHFWQRSIWVGENGAIKWDDATDWLMNECRQIGIFDDARLRGRGAWIDDGRAILHTGDRLIVEGQAKPLTLEGSPHIYEAAKPLTRVVAAPLRVREAHKLLGICDRLRWDTGASGMLLAGFIAIAPVCGGLAWRPSIWVTGGSGSGKSWALENVIVPAIGGMALRVMSKTTESGIRQTLKSDALPVIFDEFESEDVASADRVQGVLDLVRQSSSESGAAIIKGSQNQTGAKIYRIRSCFCFTSINVGIVHQADDSRISVMALRSAPANPDAAEVEAFAQLQSDVLETITPEFSAGLLARSVMLLPIIRANAEVFARAVARHAGSRRMGDQLGALLAGAYSLHSDRTITLAEAEEYVKRQDWGRGVAGEPAAADIERDEQRLLSTLMQHRLRVYPGNGAPIEATIGRLIFAAWNEDQQIPADVAEAELRASGIKTDADAGIFISTNHPKLRNILANTPWAAQWSKALARLPGSDIVGKSLRFGHMHVSKATWLSRATLQNGGA